MNKPQRPVPPPMREYHNYKRVNEHKDVEWYTQRGELFDESRLVTKIPKSWLGRLFMSEEQYKLEQALKRNREICE